MNHPGVQVGTGAHGATMLCLDRPQRRNSLTAATVEAMAAALDSDASATVVLCSATPGMFCSGADLMIDDAERRAVSDHLYEVYETMVTRPGAVIAVVDGPAVGGGAQLATAADLRVVGPNARWKWAGPGHGLAVGSWILPDLIGRGRALSLMLTQRWLSATEAVAYGLADEISTAPDEVADALVRTLAELDGAAIARIKQIASMPGVVRRLQEERDRNKAAFSGAIPSRR